MISRSPATTSPARPLVAFVLSLAAAMIVPILALTLLVTWRWVEAERANLETLTRQNVHGVVSHVDQFIVGKVATLQALATSPALDHDDFERLHAQARDVLDGPEVGIVLRDLTGQQLMNTRVPWGARLGGMPLTDVETTIASQRRPGISDLVISQVTGGPVVRIVVPVVRGDQVRYLISASLPPSFLVSLIEQAGIVAPLMGTIADRQGRIMGRTRGGDAVVGRVLPGFDRATGRNGTWTGINVDGVEVFGVYARSTISGLFFSASIEEALLSAPLYRSLSWLASAAAGLGILAAAGSALIARRLIGSHRQVEAAAVALGNGEIVPEVRTGLKETDLIARALASASARLGEQARALVCANRDLEKRVEERTREVSDQTNLLTATLDNMDQGLMMIDPQGQVAICNERALALLDLPRDLMSAHPSMKEIYAYQVAQADFVDAEMSHRRDTEVESGVWILRSYERERPNGTVLEVRTVPLGNGGAVRTFTDITARKEAERRLHRMAREDGLTGLANRTLFRERLTAMFADAAAGGPSFSVLCCDLDRFKAVNDTLGHLAGDALLREVAQRVEELAGPGDLVARLGGDEFAVIHVGPVAGGGSARLATRILEALRRPATIAGQQIHLGASLGIAVAPLDGADSDAVFRNADLALYRAKREGRNTFRFYEASMDLAVRAREELELELRDALARGEFELHYQPIVAAADERITGFEALIRWRHPVRGLVPPVEFVPVTEETRLIVPIGAWVLRQACAEATRWPSSVRLRVNISVIQVEEPDFVEMVLAALAGSGLPASRLQLEITETVLMMESDAVLDRLRAVRDAGIGLALDDFGTGYASLGYLQRLPLDGIKIDRSFVQGYRDPTTRVIFDAIVDLATGLGMRITAEGVETVDQLDFVRRAGCAEVQGFLFSRPVPAGQAADMILRRGALAA